MLDIKKKKDKEEETIEKTQAETSSIMNEFMSQIGEIPEVGNLVKNTVISIDKSAVYINMEPYGTGIIYGREFLAARDLIKKLNIGDTVTAKVVERENDDGYVELSLQEAREVLVWSEADEHIKNKTILEIIPKEANKGGLIVEWRGMQGFLPASQLKTENYPKVDDGDKNKISEELKKLIGKPLYLSIISADPKEGKLIFSEKDSSKEDTVNITQKYKSGDEIYGEVTGIVEFGVFIRIEEGLEGLIHISEIDWGLVEDPKKIFKIGDKITAKIIEIKDGKISLSLKALKENPWRNAEKKYKKGDIVEGVVIKFNQYGALISIEEGVSGLAHVSDFGNSERLKEKLELGMKYAFQITLFEPQEQKMTLSFMEKDK